MVLPVIVFALIVQLTVRGVQCAYRRCCRRCRDLCGCEEEEEEPYHSLVTPPVEPPAAPVWRHWCPPPLSCMCSTTEEPLAEDETLVEVVVYGLFPDTMTRSKAKS